VHICKSNDAILFHATEIGTTFEGHWTSLNQKRQLSICKCNKGAGRGGPEIPEKIDGESARYYL
jgi:hypothetical protein